MREIRVFDMFCGGGGSSLGARAAGARIVGGADMAEYAALSFRANFPEAKLLSGDLRKHNTATVARLVGRVDLLLSSPECTNHTCAKGSAPRSEESRETALQVLRYARVFEPRWIVLENVVHMRPWKRYSELKTGLSDLGYQVQEVVLDAADFGIPQRRRRLFMVADKEHRLGALSFPKSTAKPANSILDARGTWKTTPLRQKGRAKDTLKRAERAIAEVGTKTPFLLVYYGTDGAGGWQSLDVPLRTVTTLDRFALVEPGPNGHTMRMLQPSELRRAMGFPASYHFPEGTRRDKIRLLGNAVCPPVMKQIVAELTTH
ncbi:DNA cytosine methyltransferase [Betaproteobacteria bacterium PRO7]|jgi:DNA (cytosine-5)-methyltransferase 1|nr:DNA cytosine methyltransferase [Betaproteobacteria bacterium PRO7]